MYVLSSVSAGAASHSPNMKGGMCSYPDVLCRCTVASLKHYSAAH